MAQMKANLKGQIIMDRFILHENLNNARKSWVGSALDTKDNTFVVIKYVPHNLKIFFNNEIEVLDQVKDFSGFPIVRSVFCYWSGTIIIMNMDGFSLWNSLSYQTLDLN